VLQTKALIKSGFVCRVQLSLGDGKLPRPNKRRRKWTWIWSGSKSNSHRASSEMPSFDNLLNKSASNNWLTSSQQTTKELLSSCQRIKTVEICWIKSSSKRHRVAKLTLINIPQRRLHTKTLTDYRLVEQTFRHPNKNPSQDHSSLNPLKRQIKYFIKLLQTTK